MRAIGSACSRLALIEAEAFAVARPPAFPQELPPGADVIGFSLAGLYQEHWAAGLGAAVEALSDDLCVIVEYGALGFAEATALDATGARRDVFLERLRDRPVALSVVDPGENQGHGETPEQRNAGRPEAHAAEYRALAPEDQPQPAQRKCQGDREHRPGKLGYMAGLELGEITRNGRRKSRHHRKPAQPHESPEQSG